MSKYINFDLIKRYPNKYNLTPKSIKKLKILDWERLKKETWYNDAMKKTGEWWCHLKGSQSIGARYDDEDEFWIGFNKNNNRINCHFTSYGGMAGYNFNNFYSANEIENKYDMNVQVNTIRWLNKMIDEKILEVEDE